MEKRRRSTISGTGRSKLIDEIRSSIDQGKSFCVDDPHGDLYQEILEYVTLNRPGQRVIHIESNDEEWDVEVNYLEYDPGLRGSTSHASEAMKRIAEVFGGEDADVTPRPERRERNRPVTLVIEELTIVELKEVE